MSPELFLLVVVICLIAFFWIAGLLAQWLGGKP